MINRNINELIFLILLQTIIINNANKNGWNVKCEGKKIIMIKKLSNMTNSEEDVNNLMNKILFINNDFNNI
jgi:hypothetical protein